MLSETSSGTCPQIVTRTYQIADICGNTSTCTQTITVDDNEVPLISGTIPNSTIEGCELEDAPAVQNLAELEALGLNISDNCTSIMICY